MLCRSYLIVLGFRVNAKFPKFLVKVSHVWSNSRSDICKILVVKLLTLWRLCPKESSACKNEILTLVEHLLVNNEVFLLSADGRGNMSYLFVSEKLQETHCGLVKSLHWTQKRSLFIENFSRIWHENCRNIKTSLLDKAVRSRIPRSIASCRTCSSESAWGERGRIRLALDKSLARKLHYRHSVMGRSNERVVLFSGRTCHWLEPMGIMSCTLFDRPLFNGIRYYISGSHIKRSACAAGLFQIYVDVFRKSCFHYFLIKNVTRKNLRYIYRH